MDASSQTETGLPPPAGPSAGAVPDGRRRTLRQLRAVTALSLLLPLLAFVIVAAYLYRQEFADERVRLESTARIAQEHALKLFETNQMLLERMLDLVGPASDDEILAQGAVLHQRLRRVAAELPQVQGLYVISGDARALVNSRVDPPPREIDYSDREWYRALRGGQPIFVSEQLVSRATGEAFFDMSRRRNGADGRYAGSVHVSLRPQYLTDFYRELATTVPGLRVTVLRADGRMLARWPDPAAGAGALPAGHPVMRQLAAGHRDGEANGPSVIDGTDRLRVYRKLGDHALYVVTAVDRSVVVGAWLRRCLLLALFVVPTALGFAAMAWLALRRTREELDAVQRLDDERARRQQIEVALLRSQKLEAMGRLTGAVAHDFNNLLMVINSNLYLHRKLSPGLAGNAQLAAIERAVDSGSKLTRQLLAFARKQALKPERTALQERLPSLLDLLRPLLGAGIEIDCRVDVETRTIDVDAAELELALINLAVNARDAMQGSGRLLISARNARAAELPPALSGDYVVLDVADTGPGIDAAIAERVFEPFFTTKPLGHGTGLGLSQVQALCNSAGGIARIESVPSGGALVRLFLRAGDMPAGAPPAEKPVPQQLDGRLLLVEDNAAVAQSTRALLESMGCRVQRVDSGEAALDHLDRHAGGIDLVLSDIEMPGEVDGIALAAAVVRRHPTLPVILMTGYAARLEQAVQQQLDVLPKPCSPAMLGEAIGQALARRPPRRDGAEPAPALANTPSEPH